MNLNNGLNFIIFGIFTQRFFDLMTKQVDLFDRIHNNFFKKLVSPPSMLLIGLLVSSSGIILNAEGIYSYLTTGKVHIHWIFILMGALLVLTGMEIVIFSLLHKILNMFKEHTSLLKSDL